MSNIFKQVVTELGIKHYTSSAYHPESQGALERFHQTLKNMMRTYCTENKKDWDEGIHLLFFASRESVQDSLGYSPFELIFGHTVRGPLKLLKEQLMSEDKPRDLLTYVCTFKDRLQNACEIANNNLKQTQKDMKSRYDKNTKVRVFKPGDKVLIFLPIQGRSLNARYQGPYEIESCHSLLNYLVKTPDRRKSKQLCHVNMIKMYHSRVPDGTEKQVHNVSLVVNTSDNDNTLDGSEIGHDVRLKNSEILAKIEEKMRHLDTMQKDELSQLITEYSDLFPDVHIKTIVVYHGFNILFVSIGQNLAKDIISYVNPMSYINSIEHSIVITYISYTEVTQVISTLKNSSAVWDELPTFVAEKCISGYIEPLTYLISTSFTEGVFPKELKLARVVPIF